MRKPDTLVITGLFLLLLAFLLAGTMLIFPDWTDAHHRPGHGGGRPRPTLTASLTAAPPTATPTASPSATPSSAPTPSATPTTAPTSTPTTPPPAPTPTTTAGATPTAAPAGFVRASGSSLTLNGQPYRPVGTNAYNLASGWKTLWQCSYNAQQDLARQFNEMVNADVVRFWAFQRFATFNGQRNWEAFDRIIAEAKRTNKRLMFTFADHWGACESQGGTKDDGWYTSDYKNALRGDIATYRNYVAEVVTRYKNEPTIAFWQLANEAEAKDLPSQTCVSGNILRDFANDMAGVIRAIDTNHLISLGTLGGNQCGMGEFVAMHASMDVFEFHDYEGNAAMPTLVGQRIDQANTAGKPVIIGELGRIPDQVGGINARRDIFRAKFDAALARGADGYLVWNFHDSLHPDPPSSYGINAGDPIWTLLGGY